MTRNATGSPSRQPVSYEAGLELQEDLARRRARGELGDVLWLLEHSPTVTWGRARGREHLLLEAEEYAARGIDLCATDRGGDVTIHEPGQLVGYPIIQLEGEAERDLHLYLRRVEGALISFLAELDLKGVRIEGRTGVWLPGPPERKIAAIGVRVERWVTSHGFALNVENSLEGFGTIVPCGIQSAALTSLERELGGQALPAWPDLCDRLHRALERALGKRLELVIGPAAREL